MGKNQKLRKKIQSYTFQSKLHRSKQQKVTTGDAPWIKDYWQKEISRFDHKAKEARAKLPGRAKQSHKPKIKKP